MVYKVTRLPFDLVFARGSNALWKECVKKRAGITLRPFGSYLLIGDTMFMLYVPTKGQQYPELAGR